MNRRKVLHVGSGFLPMLFGPNIQPYAVTTEALPLDARVVNCRMSDDFNGLILLIESDEFDEVPDGMLYPEIRPMFTAVERPQLALVEPGSN